MGEVPRESGFEDQWGLVAGLPQDWEKQKLHSWRAHMESCVQKDPGEKSSDPIRAGVRPTCQCWRVSCRGGGWLCLTEGTKTLAAAVLGVSHWCQPSQRLSSAPTGRLGALVLGHLRLNNQWSGSTAPPISRQAD